ACPRWSSPAIRRAADPPIREIRLQRNGFLELGYGLLMLALEGQDVPEVGMSDREIGVEPNGLSSEPMRAFEGSGAQIIVIQRLEPGNHVGMGKHDISPSVVRIEGDGTLEELPRFINVGRGGRRPPLELWMSDARMKKSYACQVAGGFRSVRSASALLTWATRSATIARETSS